MLPLSLKRGCGLRRCPLVAISKQLDHAPWSCLHTMVVKTRKRLKTGAHRNGGARFAVSVRIELYCIVERITVYSYKSSIVEPGDSLYDLSLKICCTPTFCCKRCLLPA